jgi:hypothetical protein
MNKIDTRETLARKIKLMLDIRSLAWFYSPPYFIPTRAIRTQQQLMDTISLVPDPLDQQPKLIGDLVDQRTQCPVRGGRDVVFELFDSASDVLRVMGTTKVERGTRAKTRKRRSSSERSEGM